MRVEDMNKLERAEIIMVWSMCGVLLTEEKSSDELLGCLGIISVVDVVRKNRLSWYGHVEKKDLEDWVSKCRRLDVQGCRGRGRPKQTWEQCVKCGIRKNGMQRVEPFDKDKWRSCCGSSRPTRASMEKRKL